MYSNSYPTTENQRSLGQNLSKIACTTSQAISYEIQDQWQEASECRLNILDLYRTTLGGNAPEALAMHNLAYTYVRQGSLTEARTLQIQALDNRRYLLGDNHLDTLWSMHVLSCTHAQQQMLQEAEDLETRVISARARMLGETDPETLWAMTVLSTFYLQQGRPHDSQTLDQQVLRTIRESLRSQGVHDLIEVILPAMCEDVWKSRGTFIHETTIVVDWVQTIRGTKPRASELSRINPTDAAVSSESDLGSREARHDPHDDRTYSASPADSLETPPSSIDELQIGTHTPMQDVFKLLVAYRCLDLTNKIDHINCPIPPYAGGRFGDVWCGVLDDRARTRIAIKCLRLHTTSETCMKSVKRAARELYYWSKAKHRNVLELNGIAVFRKRLAMISPWMSNGTLSAYIYKNPGADRWELSQQVAEGLAYIHGIGMIHGDLKAINVLVSDEGIAKLSDFGNAILSDHSLAFTATTNVGGGTSRWMAPELLFGEDNDGNAVDRSKPADVYALGMTILEVITGQQPYFERKSDPYVTSAVMKGILPDRPLQFQIGTRYGNERWEMLGECWRRTPETRPTAQDVTIKMSQLA